MGLIFAVASRIFHWHCPLAQLEVWLRDKQGTAQFYSGSFIGHYAEQLVFVDISPMIIFVWTIVLILVNVCIYALGSRKSKL